jgi:hypothetical protein
MKYSINTFHLSHPMTIKHSHLGRSCNSDASIIDYFLENKKQGNGIPGVDEQGWKTEWFAHQEHSDVLGPLLDEVHLWYCTNILRPRGPKFITDQIQNTNNLHIDANVWFQEYLPGQCSMPHEHGTYSRYSWVYYADVGDDPTPLTFIQLNDDHEKVDEVHVPVYNGMIIMFPSSLLHRVSACNSNRYVIAGNINDIEYKDSE